MAAASAGAAAAARGRLKGDAAVGMGRRGGKFF